MAIPFPNVAPAGGHLVGQPFSIANLSVPVSAHFTCNCVMGNQPMLVVNSAPVICEMCGKTYMLAFNPVNQQVMVGMSEPAPKVVS